jgi:hypothetical protein
MFYKYREKEPRDPGYPVHYWSEFARPAELFARLRPDKIVFCDLETFYDVATNVAARQAGIPTFGLEHGLRYAEEVDGAYAAPSPAVVASKEWRSLEGMAQRLHTLRYYLSVFPRCTTAERLTLLKFLYRRSVDDMTVALHKFPFDLRFPDWYINYSVSNASYLMARDGVPLSRFKLIGNPSLDEFFDATLDDAHVPDEDYYLLIDSPLVEVASIGMAGEQKRAFLEKLNTFAKSRGAKLYVKLHPYSYIYAHSDSYLPRDGNIIYGRAVRVGPLLRRTKGCFGIMSTLISVVPCLNRCIVFHLPNQPFQEDLIRRGMAGGLEFHDFQPQDIDFDNVSPDPAALAAYVEHYLTKADGKATDRLRELLLG